MPTYKSIYTGAQIDERLGLAVKVGAKPNEAPINAYLGKLAYQDIPYLSPEQKPVIPLTTPTVQNVIDALLALGLVKQED